MKIKYADKKLTSIKSDVLVFAYDAKDGEPAESLLTRFSGKLLKQYKKQQEFTKDPGKALSTVSSKDPVQYCYTEVVATAQATEGTPADAAPNAARVKAFRNFGARARTQAERVQATSVAFYTDESLTGEEAQAWFEGFILCGYRYNQYKSKAHKVTVTTVTAHVTPAQKQAVQKAFIRASQVAEGIILARNLVNTPAHDMTPSKLAETAHQIAAQSEDRVQVTVLDETECEELGMHSYLAVAKGSQEPPKFIHLVYKPVEATEKRVAVIGKGVTFDSGGLSLKPANSMETMKCDMAGAATVLGLFSTLSKLNVPVEVHGIIAATENMPSGQAIRPGDIVKASNGVTIEILNTDAEGRLTLADALVYAEKYEPQAIIDLATLTGACVVALGEEIAAMYANNDKLAESLLASSAQGGEELWRMPLYGAYDKLIESKYADIRNTSTAAGYGGSITAAMFLQRFVKKDRPWAHLDIAGPAYAEKPLNAYTLYGATGYGVATLVNYLQNL